MKNTPTFTFRREVTESDCQQVRELVDSTGFFHPPEVDVAVELVQERLAKGPASGYFFVFAEQEGRTLGYACYGPIAVASGSYDLYWIAVDKSCQGQGLGRALLDQSEDLIRQEGGRQIYIETSNRPVYAPTRAFYLRCGYRQEAVLQDFYAPGDDKVIYVKVLR
jgi:D-alanine-D-alanine ligase